METLSLCVALAPMAVLAAAHALPFLFGRKELDEAQAEIRELKARLEKSEAKLDEARDKADKAGKSVAELKAENLELKAKKRDGKEEAKRIARLERDLSEKCEELAHSKQRQDGIIKGMQEELAEFKEKLTRAHEEARKAKEELTGMQELLAKKEKALQERREERRDDRRDERVVDAPAANADEVRDLRDRLERQARNLDKANEKNKTLLEELKAARAGVDGARQKLQDLETINRVLRRKVEHNRRAYIITESQLELALDDLYFQKHGKPRRETEGSRLGQPDPADLSAEDLADEPASAPPESPLEETGSVTDRPEESAIQASVAEPAASTEEPRQ